MAKYKIIGPHKVAGKAPGSTVELEDYSESTVAAHVRAGHIEPVKEDAPAPEPEPKRPSRGKARSAAPVDTDTDYDPREG